jgi:hypothetical protein
MALHSDLHVLRIAGGHHESRKNGESHMKTTKQSNSGANKMRTRTKPAGALPRWAFLLVMAPLV